MCFVALIGERIADQDLLRLRQKARELGLDHVEFFDVLRRIRHVLVGRSINLPLQQIDAVAVGRVIGDKVLVVVSRPCVVVREFLEHFHHAASRLMGGAEESLPHLVGGGFLHTAEGEELRHRGLLAELDRAHAGLARAHRHRGDPHRQADQHGNARLLHRAGVADHVSARDVASFMRQDADDLVRRFELHERTGVDEDVFFRIGHGALRREGVDLRILYEIEMHGVGIDACGFQDWHLIAAQHTLNLGIAHHVDGLRRRGLRHRAKQGESRRGEESGGVPEALSQNRRAQKTHHGVAIRQGSKSPSPRANPTGTVCTDRGCVNKDDLAAIAAASASIAACSSGDQSFELNARCHQPFLGAAADSCGA